MESQPSQAEAYAEIREVVGRAKRGDAAAVPRLRELLDRHQALWVRAGDLAAQVELSWISLAGGDDLHLRESLLRYAAKLRAELTRLSASPVETLLVERAVACWLQLNYFSGVEANALAGDASPKMLQLRAKRQAQAQRMYERALGALVTVQKLFPAAPVEEVVPIEADTTVDTRNAQDAPALCPRADDNATDFASDFNDRYSPDAALVRVKVSN